MRAGFRVPAPFRAIFMVALVYLLSLILRIGTFTETVGALGVEATYHVLWTVEALQHGPISSHVFLPTVTLDPARGVPFAWGATVATPGGSYVYTSFPPLGFLVPWVVSRLIPEGLDFLRLSLLNSMFGFVAALAMGGLAKNAAWLAASRLSPTEGWRIFAIVASVYLLLRETLFDHGAVYWPHSLSQITLISGTWLTLHMFSGRAGDRTRALLALTCFCYPSLEWTGFVFSGGVAIAALLAWKGQLEGVRLGDALLPLLSSGLAGLVIIVHFSMAIGGDAFLTALLERAEARGASSRAALRIWPAYIVSFGLLAPLAVWAGLALRGRLKQTQSRGVWLTLLVATFPMIENAIMLQHAFQFPFDRLKLAVPMLLVTTLICVTASWRHRRLVVTLGLLSVVGSNLFLYLRDNRMHRAWPATIVRNEIFATDFSNNFDSPCLLLGASASVRGYINLLFQSDIVEKTDPESLRKIIASDPDYCGFAFLTLERVYGHLGDLPAIRRIDTYDRDGKITGWVDVPR
ncbi:hypothetical protein [Pseudooceanicola onchidii]|uniref:hypothetical protein n=1 Tax=Pseudooceanicola onchidii TaxID=2562279 RepID=UPI0010AA8CCE|nr:hypothetical protein [Pseudooceanicola onchidii]